MKRQIIIFLALLYTLCLLQLMAAPRENDRHSKFTITVLYNNEPQDQRLETEWGFSCVIQGLEKTILFDTGTKGDILLSNMKILGFDPRQVDLVFLSHNHQDHTGGLDSLLKRNPKVTVYMPESFPDSMKAAVAGLGAKVIEVGGARQLLDNVRSTGETGSSIIEQSLVIDTSNGPVLITGCAHPGIVNILKKVGKKGSKRILMVLGGFHLLQTEPAGIREIIGEFRKAGVEKVGPTHCTGGDAIAMFREAWGGEFVNGGCGAVISLDK